MGLLACFDVQLYLVTLIVLLVRPFVYYTTTVTPIEYYNTYHACLLAKPLRVYMHTLDRIIVDHPSTVVVILKFTSSKAPEFLP